MNWLAHLYLSDGSDENMLGNLLGDFIVNVNWREKYSEKIRQGILMHFAIDKFTDSHPLFLKSCNRISKKNSRYSGVLIDIFYDHILAKSWSDYSEVKLEDFTGNFYRVLHEKWDILPQRLTRIAGYMIESDWLCSYRDISAIDLVLQRISARFKKAGVIEGGIEELTGNYDGLKDDFEEFFPELMAYASHFLANIEEYSKKDG